MINPRDGAECAVTLHGNQTGDGPNSAVVSQSTDDIHVHELAAVSSSTTSATVAAGSISPTAAVSTANGKSKYRVFLKVLQKINMVFLVLFVCYFVWTVSANYARNYGDDTVTGNITSHINASHYQVGLKNTSGNSQIPFASGPPNNKHDDITYHTNVVIPAHRKRAKKRRKKGRGKNRHRRLRNRHNSSGTIEEYLNLTAEPRRYRKDDNTCKNCKIKKRKSRNRIDIGLIKASTLRRILEKVADETMSGARFGDGTFINLQDENNGKESGWSNNQHKVDVTLHDTSSADDVQRNTGDSRTDESVTSWTGWSSCSATCGAGQRERMRDCGAACREVESMVCIRPACKDVSSDDSLSTITEFYKWEKAGFIPPLKPPKQEFLDPNVDVCSEWVNCNRKIAHEYFTNSTLPACPCFYPLKRDGSQGIHDAKRDKTFIWDDASSHSDLVYKPEARTCIRSRLSPGAVNLAVQQCCYDATFTLVTRGKSAGTPNLISVDISKELHYKLDLLPWIICKGDWTRYNQVMPPDNQLTCPSNPDDFTIRRQTEEVKLY